MEIPRAELAARGVASRPESFDGDRGANLELLRAYAAALQLRPRLHLTPACLGPTGFVDDIQIHEGMRVDELEARDDPRNGDVGVAIIVGRPAVVSQG